MRKSKTASAAGVNLNNDRYVKHLFRAFLGREPDPAGLSLFTNALDNGTDLRDVIDSLVESPEFAQKTAVAVSELEHWSKVHLMGVLSASLGLTSYLEITTTNTGFMYREARDLSFKTCLRLVYRMAALPKQDDLPVDFGSETENIDDQLAEMRRRKMTFDLIFLDAHHTYECAARDLAAAYSFLSPGGVIVVHDCNPPTRQMASPEIQEGGWCGVTYQSFIDYCLGNPAIDYFTFNADLGCGVIMKPRTLLRAMKNRVRARRQSVLLARWSKASKTFDGAFTMFEKNRKPLLRLVDFGGLRGKLSSGG